jgi:EAL domain-containing protein (putative c-di-GMP-specific phosphodiesterase class I)
VPPPPKHLRERERLASLRSYQVLDTGPDAAFDAITAAAARTLGAPAAVIGLVDEHRQWFKAASGLAEFTGYPVRETPLDVSFCAHVVAAERPVVVPDARLDPRFAENPLVTGTEDLRSYAGAPITGRDGLPLGALCVLDHRPRHYDDSSVRALADLAGAVAELLELRRLDVSAGLGSRDLLGESRRLRAGIDGGELVVHYQPVVEIASGRWLGMEALVRWADPERGLLPPSAFLPVAEASGLIVPLGRAVLLRACEQVAQWRREVPAAADLHVAVNVSGRQLREPDVVDDVAEALLVSGLPAEALTVELTETSLADTCTEVDLALQRIRASGVTLALDDFGTGYASFSYLRRFQPDVVKLDRCFVEGLNRSPRDDLLAQTLVDLALRLGCLVVAEGIEHPDQARALTRLGVRRAQGFLFSAARDPHQLFQQVLPQSRD